MAVEIAEAYLSLIPSTSKIAPAVRQSLGQVERDSTSTSGRMGSSLGSSLKSAVSSVGAGVTALAATVGGLALGGGIARALSIENAQAKLTGLGHDASSVTQIMQDALASVKGTAYGLGDAATVAAGLVAAGVQQGPQLEGILKTVADTATISGRSLTDIGTIFGSVAARGKLQGDDMLQLMSSGVPVLQMLSNQLGVSSADVSTMVTKGQIDFATFASAIQSGMGGAALASGTTFTGALSNVRAALSRLGAQVATPILASLKGVFNDAIPAIDGLTANLSPLISALADRLSPVIANVSSYATDLIKNLDFSSIGSTVSALSPILAPIAGMLGAMSTGLLSSIPFIGQLLPNISGPLGLIAGIIGTLVARSPELRAALGDALWTIGGILQNLAPLMAPISSVVGTLASILATALVSALRIIEPILVAIELALVPIGSWMTRNVGIMTSVSLAVLAGVAAWKAWTLAVTLWSAATKAAAAVQAVFNAIQAANPVMIVVIAIAALVAGLVYFFTQTKIGQQIWQDFTSALATAWQWLSTTAQQVWAAIQAAAAPVIAWFQQYVSPIFAAFGELASAVFSRIATVVSWLWKNIFQPQIALIMIGWQFLWGAIQAVWDTIGPPLIAYITGAWNVMSAILSGVWNVLVAVFTGIWNAIVIVIETVLGVIKGVINVATSLIKGDWSGAWEAVKGIFSTIWDGITRAAQNTMETLGSTFTAAKDAIMNVFSTAGDWLKDVGKSIIQGLIDGFEAMFDTVKSTLSKLTGFLPDWKGPASVDAKLLTGNGRLIMQSLVAGFQDEEPAVKKYLAGFTTSLSANGVATVNVNGQPGAGAPAPTFNIYESTSAAETAAAVARRMSTLGA